MRNNQPVTDSEYIVPEGITLVSKTDLNGTIIECNDAFEAASGFSRSELIGQPHNLVRHPDVPAAIFADLWATLKLGAPWSQIVKNRRADGGFYWVRANATPIYQDGKISGYMSVRCPPSAQEKQAAEQAYQDIDSGKATIKHGKVHYGPDLSRLNFYSRINPQYQLALMFGLFYLLPYLIYAGIANHSLIEMLMVTVLGLIPPFVYGLQRLKQERNTRALLRQVASNDLIDMSPHDPTSFNGKLHSTIKSASLAALERIEESAYQLDNANRLQTAIDQVSANVMIADSNLNIIYMNNVMLEFMRERESRLQTALPNLNADKILGSNIDVFHQNPAHNRAMLQQIKEPTTTTIQVAGYHLELNVIPVYNRAGIQTSTLVEWRDLTADIQLMEQVNGAVQSAKNGLLDRRIDLSKVDGVARELSESINDMLAIIEEPINASVEVAVALSDGDLTQYMKGDNYLGRFAVMQDSMNVAVENLSSMMAQSKAATSNVSDGAEQINQGSHDLNDRTQNQAASLEETAASMEQMTSAVKQNADNAMEAASVTHTTASQAKSGVEVMHSAIIAMEQINESSQKINDIIGLIDSIAFQTNLLALNAAVEAARAGEHGRGFAVVAGEVRNLAGKSADAAKDIRQLIEDTVNKVSEGTHHVKGSGDALNEIVESISNVNQIIEEIASSSQEQSEGVGQVNQAITSIDSAVQQNAALVEETAATAVELGDMAKMMMQNVNQFKINELSASINQSMQPGSFDFHSAKRGVRQWRVKVRAYINDVSINFDRNTAADPSKCFLGEWIYGAGKQFQAMPSYQALEQSHAELHALIERALSLKDAGDTDTANASMIKLIDVIEQVIQRIGALEHDMNHGGISIAEQTMLEKNSEAPQADKKRPHTKTQAGKPVSTDLQTPPPAQPKGNDNEWSEF